MSVRFVIGRAGVGKTHHCLTSVRERVLADPLDGPALIVLVPEQASLQTERALLDHPGLAAVHRAAVLSFQRLAFRVLEDAGADSRKVLSTDGRRMVLRHLVARLAPDLRYFKRPERFPGLLDRLGGLLDELIQESVSPTDFAQTLEVPDSVLSPQSSALKLHDLHRIYAAYLDYLGAERLDPSQRLDIARQRLARCPWLHGAEVWVDGFAGFTRQERNLLVALARIAARMEITLLVESAEYGVRSAECKTIPNGLFAKTARTLAAMKHDFEEYGVAVEAPLVLDPPTPPRFKDASELAAIERHIFRDDHTLAPHSALRTPHSSVQIVQAADRRVEVNYVVAAIAHLVQSDETLRYRDIGLAVRDLEPYHDLLTAALDARRIPYFIDRRRPTRHHPLVECLRALVQVALDPLTPEAVRPLLKCGLIPLDPEDLDAIENHLIAAAPSGRDAWSRPWNDRTGAGPQANARLNRARESLLDLLSSWLDFASGAGAPPFAQFAKGRGQILNPQSSGAWAAAISEQLERLGVAGRLDRWIQAAEESGELDRAEEHRQIQTDLARLLEDLAGLLPDEPLTLRGLAQMLDAALAHLTLGLTPPTLDQLLITAVERSRNPDLKVLFVLGFNDGQFPRTPTEDALLGDEDREWLAARAVELRPPSTELLRDERLLAYIAFTRASHRLIVSYAAADENGGELRPSPWLEDLRAACPNSGFTAIDDPFRSRTAWDVRNVSDLAAHLAYEFGVRPLSDSEDVQPAVSSPDGDGPRGLTPSATPARPASDSRRLWNALYEGARNHPDVAPTLRRALAALDYRNQAALSPASTAGLFTETFHASVSQLETFAACPFQHFALYPLKLKPRQEAQLRPLDVGRVHHAVLEHLTKGLVAEGRTLAELDDRAVADRLDASFTAVAAVLPEMEFSSRSRDAWVLARTRRQLERVLRAQRAAAQLGRFKPRAAELPFGMDREGSLPALEIDTPAGRKILLRGVIDRVDLAEDPTGALGLVIDYKLTRDKRLSLANVYHGLSLQLMGYLLVLQQHGAKLIPTSDFRLPTSPAVAPAAALYVSLVDTYDKVDHPSAAGENEVDAPPPGVFPPRGILDLARMTALDRNFDKDKRSAVYQVSLTQKGTISRLDHSDAAEAEDFTRLLGLAKRRIGELADAILDGRADIRPYRLAHDSPCSRCDYRAVCRFEFPTTPIRSLEPLKRSQVFETLKFSRDS